MANPALNAFQNNDGTVSLKLTLDQVEKENFGSEITWAVSVLGGSDVSDLEAYLVEETSLIVEIPAEHFNSDEYTFIATTEYERTA